jgi:hypothetical protein
MNGILSHLRANAVAYLALFIALGGTSYAALSVPANSVGTRQIRNHSITPIKFDPGKIGAYVRAWAVIENGTQVVSSKPRARVISWDPSFAAGVVSWGSAITRACFPLTSGSGEFVQAAILPGARGRAEVHFDISNNSGQPEPNGPLTYVAVLCPEP